MGVKNREGIDMVAVACGNSCFFWGFKEVDLGVSPCAETVCVGDYSLLKAVPSGSCSLLPVCGARQAFLLVTPQGQPQVAVAPC